MRTQERINELTVELEELYTLIEDLHDIEMAEVALPLEVQAIEIREEIAKLNNSLPSNDLPSLSDFSL